MEVAKSLCMKGGIGEASYANNSVVQVIYFYIFVYRRDRRKCNSISNSFTYNFLLNFPAKCHTKHIGDNWRSHQRCLHNNSSKNDKHCRLGLFFGTEYFAFLITNNYESRKEKKNWWIHRVSDLLEWSSQQWFQQHFQIFAKFSRKFNSRSKGFRL